MKKITFALALLLSAGASAADIRPYAGLDLSGLSADLDDGGMLEDKYNAASLNLGAKIGERFGAEFFYKQTGKETTRDLIYIPTGTPIEIETSFSGFGIAALGFLSLAEKMYFEPSLGFGMYQGKAEMCDAAGYGICMSDKDDRTFGITLGLGLAYGATENIDIRGGFKYTKFDDGDFSVKDFTELYLGARYVF
jgi:opacity protein-like surface antigen